MLHIYSDSLSKLARTVPCYSINEVLSEKLRALIQRSYTAPCDFYDIWCIANIEENLDWQEITKAFHRKMEVKGLIFTGIEQMINPENDKRLKAAWHNSLGHQIKKEFLPEYDKVKKDLKIIIKGKMKKNQHLKFSFAILFFMVITIRGIEAANYVKVAAIGSHPGIVDKSNGMQGVVDQVIEFWRDELPWVQLI